MRDKYAGLRQEAGAEGAQTDDRPSLVHPSACGADAQEIPDLKPDVGRDLPRSVHFEQSRNLASAQGQAASTSWLAGQSSEWATLGEHPAEC